jgi:hypothetical protein
MARKSKIEEYKLESFIDDLLFEDENMTHMEIARLCSREVETSISNMAVKRYLESKQQTEQRKKKEVITQDRRRVLKQVNQDFDIIQLQYQTTERLLKRFEMVDNLPEYFEEKMEELIDRLLQQREDFNYVKYIERWQGDMNGELHRKVYEIATLNRELRENSKFLADLREKAFEFSLIQEYLSLFMDIFKDASPAAYEVALQKIASNPRMQKIVDQQMQLRGE